VIAVVSSISNITVSIAYALSFPFFFLPHAQTFSPMLKTHNPNNPPHRLYGAKLL
jgi:hypothetical protein